MVWRNYHKLSCWCCAAAWATRGLEKPSIRTKDFSITQSKIEFFLIWNETKILKLMHSLLNAAIFANLLRCVWTGVSANVLSLSQPTSDNDSIHPGFDSGGREKERISPPEIIGTATGHGFRSRPTKSRSTDGSTHLETLHTPLLMVINSFWHLFWLQIYSKSWRDIWKATGGA